MHLRIGYVFIILAALCSCTGPHKPPVPDGVPSELRLGDYLLWCCVRGPGEDRVPRAASQPTAETLTLERHDPGKPGQVDYWPAKLQTDATLATACVWKEASSCESQVTCANTKIPDIICKTACGFKATDGGETACAPLAISERRNLLLVVLSQEIAGPDCYYPSTYAVVSVEDGRVLTHHRVCGAMPLEQCSGFVEAGSVLAYVLGEPMASTEAHRPVLALIANGDHQVVQGVSADGIAASPDGCLVALVSSDDGTAEVELRSADLTRSLWRREWKISPGTNKYDSCNRLLWSSDGRLVCLYVKREPSGPDTLLALDSRNGHIWGSYDRKTKRAETKSPMCVVKKGTPFDAEAAFGIVRTGGGM
jgi:hypothetical protein